MTNKKRKEDSNLGLTLVVFSFLLVILAKSAYLYRVGATFNEAMLGVLPNLACLFLLSWIYVTLSMIRRHWIRRIARLVVVIVSLLAAFATIIAAGGYWKTGSIPRLQQLHGLTWNIVAPSVREMAQKNVSIFVLVLIAILLALGMLWAGLNILRRHQPRPRSFWAGIACLIVLVATVLASEAGIEKHGELIVTRLFRSDLDLQAASSESFQRAEAKFFLDYHARLSQTEGAPRYPVIRSQLHGSNVIWLVLESTRAKDVPLYGGSADMPNMMKARDHMILLKNLYSQDPRSTKTYAQMNMGRFGLLSWDSYPNNIPWMFPEDGIASHLDKLGYSTAVLVNGDGSYDHHKAFDEHHGYQSVLYRRALNPGTPAADDLRMLDRVGEEFEQVKKPFYMMLWPIQTHHPYGREYWAHPGEWLSSHPGGMTHAGAADHDRYMQALHEADDWFGRVIELLKQKGEYENTVIIVTGDHGEAFGEHEPGNVFHGNGVYQESVHVTGFIYSPKINGLHEDDRYLRLVDIPATILDMTSGTQYLLNDGRSILNNYKYPMPIYLFNSWAGAAGIIYDGYKLWHREKASSPVYYASMAEIHQDPAKERQVAGNGQGKVLLGMLNDWEVAMKARTASLLTERDPAQTKLDDVIRVYCDDGAGFRESLRFSDELVGLSGAVTIPIDHDCRALRIAPIKNTEIADGETLEMDVESLQVVGAERSWQMNDMRLAGWGNLTKIDNSHFSITSDSAFFDYSLGSQPRYIKFVTLKASFVWHKLRSH